MIATSGFLTALEYTKFVFGLGSAPDPAGRAYSAPQTPGLRVLLLRGGERKERGKDEEEKRRDRPSVCKFLGPSLHRFLRR